MKTEKQFGNESKPHWMQQFPGDIWHIYFEMEPEEFGSYENREGINGIVSNGSFYPLNCNQIIEMRREKQRIVGFLY